LDGISLLQTAEGAMNEVHNILQRVRELAVQGANGIYTSNDRNSIQIEVSQLLSEIDRIAQTTEFNSKKLLDGTLGALTSTDDPLKLQALITGNVGKGGNFNLQMVPITTGQLQVQKTDVFTTMQSADAVGKLNYLKTYLPMASIATAGVDGIGNTFLTEIVVPISASGQGAVSNGTARFTINSLGAAAGASSVATLLNAKELTVGVDTLTLTYNTSLTATVTLLSVADETLTELAAAISTATGVATTIGAGGNLAFGVGGTVNKIVFNDVDGSGSQFFVSMAGAAATNSLFSGAGYSLTNAIGTYSQSIGGAGVITGGKPVSIGNAAIGAFQIRLGTDIDSTVVGEIDTITVSEKGGVNELQRFGNITQLDPPAASGTYLVSAVTNRTYAVFSFDNAAYNSLVAGGMDQTDAVAGAKGGQIGVTQSIAKAFDATGTVLEGVRIAFDAIFQAGETATFNVSTNQVLTADQATTLGSIGRFIDNGVFNGRNSVEMRIYMRGQEQYATVNISKNDTLEDLTGKMSLALANPLLLSDLNAEGALNPTQYPDLVHMNTIGAAKGTISITTPAPGSQIVMAGDEALLRALSLIEVQQAVAPVYSINAINVETGVRVGSIRTDSNEIVGLLGGVKMYFDTTTGMKLDPQPPTGGDNAIADWSFEKPIERPVISLSGEIATLFVHIAPRALQLQTGANQGQQMTTFIEDMSTKSLGIEGLLVVSEGLAQEAISKVDVAIGRVSDGRGRLGAIQNRLESTIRNLDIAAENLTASESRIRDVDIAKETMNATRLQILLQAGTAALAQANQIPQAVLNLLR
jgi:flagellin